MMLKIGSIMIRYTTTMKKKKIDVIECENISDGINIWKDLKDANNI